MKLLINEKFKYKSKYVIIWAIITNTNSLKLNLKKSFIDFLGAIMACLRVSEHENKTIKKVKNIPSSNLLDIHNSYTYGPNKIPPKMIIADINKKSWTCL